MATAILRLESIVSLEFSIRAVTGLHIGGSDTGITIGGSDNPVIRSPLTGRPYVPGSSFKGKMRSLLERRHGYPTDWEIGKFVKIHTCETEAAHKDCKVCPLFGIPAPTKNPWFCLTRLRFSDVPLTDASAEELDKAKTDLPFVEVKMEAAIDRTTSAATPRNIDRVPAGALFGPARVSLFRYEGDQAAFLDELADGLELVEADYLGGSGARGSGRVGLENIAISRLRMPKDGALQRDEYGSAIANSRELRAALDDVKRWIDA